MVNWLPPDWTCDKRAAAAAATVAAATVEDEPVVERRPPVGDVRPLTEEPRARGAAGGRQRASSTGGARAGRRPRHTYHDRPPPPSCRGLRAAGVNDARRSTVNEWPGDDGNEASSSSLPLAVLSYSPADGRTSACPSVLSSLLGRPRESRDVKRRCADAEVSETEGWTAAALTEAATTVLTQLDAVTWVLGAVANDRRG